MTTLWDNIKRGFKDSAKFAKEGATIAAEKAEELGKKSKVMLDISNIKRKIEKQFTELGGKVYHEMHVNNVADFSSHEGVQNIVKSIKELEDELLVKQEEMEQIGKMKDIETETEPPVDEQPEKE